MMSRGLHENEQRPSHFARAFAVTNCYLDYHGVGVGTKVGNGTFNNALKS
jgi:hypothetical protein